MERIDNIAKGKGFAVAQAKVTRADGSVEYYYSKPNFKPWNLIGWAWYFSHRRNIRKQHG